MSFISNLDIDECIEKLHNCSDDENRTCYNVVGGFQCICKSGYMEVDGICVGKTEVAI